MVSQHRGEEERTASAGSILRWSKAGGGINAPGAVIVLQHFEGQLAAAQLTRALLDRREEHPADACAAVGGRDKEVVDIYKRADGKRSRGLPSVAAFGNHGLGRTG